jgi:hypothetical protein
MVDDLITFIENEAAGNYCAPERIVARVRHDASPETDFGQLHAALEARIADLALAVKDRPDHAKLRRGIGTMQKVAQVLAPEGAEVELTDLAEKIRVCVTKSDNYAATAGQHLRAARERCRAIGLDFNKWCAQADLGIKRSRIYQLMGPDPIAAARRDENNNEEPENVQSTDVAQLTNVERQSVSDQVIDSLKAHIQQWWMKTSEADRLAFGQWFDELRQPEAVAAE